MAGIDAAIATTLAIRTWRPQCVLLVGIAGGVSPDVELGDVVVAQTVMYYERGKATSSGQLDEVKMAPCDSILVSTAQSINWTPIIPVVRPDGLATLPKVVFGSIAAGEKVVADQLFRDRLTSHDRKLLALEMEGYGFSRAISESLEKPRHLVIKAVCDRADASKDQAWQSYAAASAANFARNLLLDVPVNPKPVVEGQKRNLELTDEKAYFEIMPMSLRLWHLC
jgi:nucleoside phosphorylase